MRRIFPFATGLGIVFGAGLALAAEAPTALPSAPNAAMNPEAIEFFEKKIRPLLVENCYTCHSANTNARGGLRVDDRNGLLSGGDQGAAIVPGAPDDSLLLSAVKHEAGSPKMPPGKQLTPEQIGDLTKWIADGAAWPALEIPSDLVGPKPEYAELIAEHWAWQPLQKSVPPEVKESAWPLADLDRYLLAKLEAENLKPVASADKRTLIRRASFDLTGLPPTTEEVAAFLSDDSEQAFAKVIDRLLASPAFGEHWGRHWLDVARYGESTGSSRNVPYPHAWRYRDYVIDAFQKDKPYDQFLREQIAGDLLPAVDQQQRDEQLIATGFLALGVKDVNQRFKVRFIMDNVDEQIDSVSRSVLALTVSCARCHDHKFDPISTAEYYALAGIFESSDLCAGVRNKMGGGGLDYYDTSLLLQVGDESVRNSAPPEKIEELKTKLAAARQEFQALRDSPEGNEKAPNGRPKRNVARQKMNRLQAELAALSDPAVQGPVAYGVRDAKVIRDTEIRLRGEAELMGPVVPRGFLELLTVEETPAISASSSGRLELAQWLTSPQNPMTSRVMVNRIWSHLFSRGLVSTVDNFGINGDVPTHPELLDHLAARFVEQGWSVKRLVRDIMLSRAYQLSSENSSVAANVDPANRLVWRHSPRRLTAEEIRDSMLASANSLDAARPQGSPAQEMQVRELRNNGPEARQLAEMVAANHHRSVYLPLLRGLVPASLEVFDFAEQGMVTGSRDVTTVAPQALYLLNNAMVRRSSLQLAETLLKQEHLSDAERVEAAYQTILGRSAAEPETVRVQAYITEFAAAAEEFELLAQSTADETMLAQSAADESTAEAAAGTGAGANANPDEADQTDAPIQEEVIAVADSRTAAWMSFCQALFGSAEFRYVR
ncbi:PSD1 and planctomycete cytochrome C domain-containing protein [Planctomicrobium piriforme]|uniref:Planctomycete cytochrome C n=1 Tax=Planctomicrobium piriforme TaxID=1576369 RepID=A0A1I3MXR6_9PLAN|nr:PSD1 and planctomycete cytochrome C domain-containing protein [Planctomicrobium piriforme]SFJ01749.1 Planctomycete cytochrome C [Planctomicrobium piriforme]